MAKWLSKLSKSIRFPVKVTWQFAMSKSLVNMSEMYVLGSPNRALWGPGPAHPGPEVSTNIFKTV